MRAHAARLLLAVVVPFVRPEDEILPTVLRHSEQLKEDRERENLGEICYDVAVPYRGEPVQDRLARRLDMRLKWLDCRRGHPRDQDLSVPLHQWRIGETRQQRLVEHHPWDGGARGGEGRGVLLHLAGVLETGDDPVATAGVRTVLEPERGAAADLLD